MDCGSVRQSSVEQFDLTAANDAVEFLCGVWRSDRRAEGNSSRTFIHSLIREFVGFLVVAAKHVLNLKPIQFASEFTGAAVEIAQGRLFHFIDALHLSHQQF